jgi:hypothetical protein
LDENFFDIGGNSLEIIKLRDLLAERGVASLELTDFFKYPTVRTLAEAIGSRAERPAAVVPLALPEAADRRQRLHRLRSRNASRSSE